MPVAGNSSGREGQLVRVLLVEDSATDRELVERALCDPAPLPEVALEGVGDADAALAAVRGATFEVILLDHSLPGQSGLDLLRQLREAEDETPVVMMTGQGDEALAVAALQQGAADYVVKNLGFERTLPVVIERVLGRRALELEQEGLRTRAARYAKQLERQVEDQTRSLRQALQESEALRRVGRALAAARELKPALDLVVQTTAQLLDAQAAAALIRADTQLVIASVWGALKQPPGLKSHDLIGALGSGWQETATGPLRDGDVEIGVLWAGRTRLQPFAPRELELLYALADMTALSIANVRAHERLRRHAESGHGQDGDRGHAAPAPTSSAPSVVPRVKPPPAEPLDPSGLVVPPFPAALGRLLGMAESDDARPEAIEEAVGLDPALATRAIQLASAPALGRARPASSLREALMVLGLRGVRNLAFALFSRRMVIRWGVIDQLLWEQSLATAAGAQLLVEAREPGAGDDAYLCGLLLNVGAVALNNAHPDRYERTIRQAIAEARPFPEVEREEFGADTASLTQLLAARWSLPARVGATLRSWQRRAPASSIEAALRWASTAALRTSPVWQTLLGDQPEPDWIGQALDAAAGVLALAPDALEEIRHATAVRSEVLRGLAS